MNTIQCPHGTVVINHHSDWSGEASVLYGPEHHRLVWRVPGRALVSGRLDLVESMEKPPSPNIVARAVELAVEHWMSRRAIAAAEQLGLQDRG